MGKAILGCRWREIASHPRLPVAARGGRAQILMLLAGLNLCDALWGPAPSR
ncbi:hypothetical protein HMPREF0262_03664 [Clostridium sp. ATCC 29733]|nr:hypothetical protein HMPREF0262_03664 [Clostridium sp. ATCC 29733]